MGSIGKEGTVCRTTPRCESVGAGEQKPVVSDPGAGGESWEVRGLGGQLVHQAGHTWNFRHLNLRLRPAIQSELLEPEPV